MNVSDRIGTTLGILAAVIGIFSGGFLLGDTANPEVADKVLAPSPAFNPCPDGWDYKPAQDEHTRVEGCENKDWRVILDPVTFKCNIAMPIQGGPFRACADVPGWTQ